MDIKKLQTLVIDALEDVKAQEIKVFDTTNLTSLFERVVIASGTSNRQTKALAASVRDKVKQNGGNVVGMEGEGTGEWVLVDLGDIIVHVMQPTIRAYYRLEEIWGEKEVKLGAAKRKSATKPAESSKIVVSPTMQSIQASLDDDEPKKPARKPRTTTSTVAAGTTGTPRAPRKRAAANGEAAVTAPSGGRVKVAATKTAVASSKEAAAKRTTRAPRRKTAE